MVQGEGRKHVGICAGCIPNGNSQWTEPCLMHELAPPSVSAVSLSTLVISLDTASFVYTHSATGLYVACIIRVAPTAWRQSTGSRTAQNFSQKIVEKLEVAFAVTRFDALVALTACLYIAGRDAL